MGALPLAREQVRLFVRLLISRYGTVQPHRDQQQAASRTGARSLTTKPRDCILERLLHPATTINVKGTPIAPRKEEGRLLGRTPRPIDAEEAATPG
jgi:hypothetical protein